MILFGNSFLCFCPKLGVSFAVSVEITSIYRDKVVCLKMAGLESDLILIQPHPLPVLTLNNLPSY